MARMAVFNVAGYLIIEESRRSTVISASEGVLNFMLSITRFATFMFYLCGVRQVRFKNRYLTVFHT